MISQGASAGPLRSVSAGPGQGAAHRFYDVSLGKAPVAGILRQVDWTAGEHEHPEAQLSMLFQGNAANLLTHDERGKTTRTRIAAESFVFIAPGQPHRVNWKSDGEILNLWIPNDVLRELSEQVSHSVVQARGPS